MEQFYSDALSPSAGNIKHSYQEGALQFIWGKPFSDTLGISHLIIEADYNS